MTSFDAIINAMKIVSQVRGLKASYLDDHFVVQDEYKSAYELVGALADKLENDVSFRRIMFDIMDEDDDNNEIYNLIEDVKRLKVE